MFSYIKDTVKGLLISNHIFSKLENYDLIKTILKAVN